MDPKLKEHGVEMLREIEQSDERAARSGARRKRRQQRNVYKALQDCVDELERLRFVLLPQYEGKLGEPDARVIKRAHKALKG